MNTESFPGPIELSRELPLRLGGVEIRPATREIVAGAERDLLEPRVMQVLVALARRRGAVVSREELILTCWSGRVVSDDAINRCISRVRAVAETYGGFTLETVARVGYRLMEKPATAAPAPVFEAVKAAHHADVKAWLKRHRLLVTALVALAIGLVAGALWPPFRTPAAPASFTVAVLPFTPPPGDSQGEALGDAIATSIADMMVSEGFVVVSPAKTGRFRGAAKADAAQALHATFIIDGEVHREAGKITVPLRIIDGASGTTLVADSVEAADPAVLPEAVATNVMSSGWNWIPNLDAASPKDLPVIIGTLRAVRHLQNPSETLYTYDFAKQLAAARPDAAYAHLLLAETAARIVPRRYAPHRLPVMLEARAAVAKLLALDPNAGDAYGPLSLVTPTIAWNVRENYLRQGLRLRPTAPLVYMDLIALRMNEGYLHAGGRMAEEAFSNHPHFDLTTFQAINARLWLGDPKAARTLAAHAVTLWPRRAEFAAKLFEATALAGDLDGADKFLNDAAAASLLQPQGESGTYRAIVAALRHGRPNDVKTVTDDCMGVTGRTPEVRSACFLALVKLGRPDDAFRMAELLYPDQRGADAAEIERRWLAQMPHDTALLVIPATAPMRADARYRDVVERVGLLKLWRERGTPPDFCATEKAPVCALLKP